ncbi:hypothetical protein J0K78_06365 [Halobacillus sp. GSS1]|uniref:hypothetical protein n=1 Tax=Halobacillus sp. GSS1 TaxID=2815919 RepID=UPI001A8C7B38|nr:hypothetical protein [Halobacillus sp. GSS1]MBN9653884.1 hypothetical protein [Halobacillus sp. GSS1]
MTIYLDDYKTFDSTQELNYHIKQHELANHDVLTVSNREILRFISRYSVKYSGAAHLKANTIAEGVQKSVRTIQRTLSKLEELGIIERISTIRIKSGGSGANIIVIQPFVTARLSDREVTEKAREDKGKVGKPPKETIHNRSISSNTFDTDSKPLNHPVSLKNSIPKKLYDALSPFFNADDLYKTIGTLYRAKATIDRDINSEDHEEYINAFYAVMRRYKNGKVRDLYGYLYSAWRKVSRRIFFKSMIVFDT